MRTLSLALARAWLTHQNFANVVIKAWLCLEAPLRAQKGRGGNLCTERKEKSSSLGSAFEDVSLNLEQGLGKHGTGKEPPSHKINHVHSHDFL